MERPDTKRQKTIKILLDVDTGVDDSMALFYALRKKEVEIVGITTVCGNVEASLATENTLKVLDVAGAPDIPVVTGYEEPMEGTWEGRVTVIHGENGIGNVKCPASDRSVCQEDVRDFQMRMAEAYEKELVLVTLGPLTNIAGTLEKYPEFATKVKRVVMMGGTVNAPGNVSPVCEANFACDPVACDKVFTSGMDITVAGLDVTTAVRLKKEHIGWLDKQCSPDARPAVEYMKESLTHYFRGNQIQNYCIDDCPFHDPLAMMIAVVPDVVTFEKRKARIECTGTYTRGMVVTDLREHPIDAEYITFAMGVRADRVMREFLSVFWKE